MSDDPTIVPTPRDDFELDVGGEMPRLGPLPVELPNGDGRHVGTQCGCATTLDAMHREGYFVVLFLGKADDPKLDGMGFYIAMRPDEARGVAAGILRAADKIDNGRGKQ